MQLTFGDIDLLRHYVENIGFIHTMMFFTSLIVLLQMLLTNASKLDKRIKFNTIASDITKDIGIPFIIGVIVFLNGFTFPFTDIEKYNILCITLLSLFIYGFYFNRYYKGAFIETIYKLSLKFIIVLKILIIYFVSIDNIILIELTSIFFAIVGIRLFILIYERGLNINQRETDYKTDKPVTSESMLFPERKVQLQVVKQNLIDNSESFSSVAICGKWGSGKTSFLNVLVNELEKEKNVKTIRINPNVDCSATSMSEQLFSQLKFIMSDSGVYSGIGSSVDCYERTISRILKNTNFAWIASVINQYLLKEETLDDRALRIRLENDISELSSSNLKLLIAIDDLDRCSKEVIKETLKFFSSIFQINGCTMVFLISNEMLESDNSFFDKYITEKFELTTIDHDVLINYYYSSGIIVKSINGNIKDDLDEFAKSKSFSIKKYIDDSATYLKNSEKSSDSLIKDLDKFLEKTYKELINPRKIKHFLKEYDNSLLQLKLLWYENEERLSNSYVSANLAKVTFELTIIKVFLVDAYIDLVTTGEVDEIRDDFSRVFTGIIFDINESILDRTDKLKLISILSFRIHSQPTEDEFSSMQLSLTKVLEGKGERTDYINALEYCYSKREDLKDKTREVINSLVKMDLSKNKVNCLFGILQMLSEKELNYIDLSLENQYTVINEVINLVVIMTDIEYDNAKQLLSKYESKEVERAYKKLEIISSINNNTLIENYYDRTCGLFESTKLFLSTKGYGDINTHNDLLKCLSHYVNDLKKECSDLYELIEVTSTDLVLYLKISMLINENLFSKPRIMENLEEDYDNDFLEHDIEELFIRVNNMQYHEKNLYIKDAKLFSVLVEKFDEYSLKDEYLSDCLIDIFDKLNGKNQINYNSDKWCYTSIRIDKIRKERLLLPK